MLLFGLAALELMLAATPMSAATRICIDTRNIKSSLPQDHGKSILFTMRDGAQWRNTLQSGCPDLDFNGFQWTVRNPDNTVCDGEQSLQVLQSGQICQLGKFEKVTPGGKPG